MDKSSITAREWHVRKALPEDLPMIGNKLEGPAVDFFSQTMEFR